MWACCLRCTYVASSHEPTEGTCETDLCWCVTYFFSLLGYVTMLTGYLLLTVQTGWLPHSSGQSTKNLLWNVDNKLPINTVSCIRSRRNYFMVLLLWTFDNFDNLLLTHSFIHSSLYFLYIHIQAKYQGCGNSCSYCKNICQNCRCQIFKYNYSKMVT